MRTRHSRLNHEPGASSEICCGYITELERWGRLPIGCKTRQLFSNVTLPGLDIRSQDCLLWQSPPVAFDHLCQV
jgi:hypothetical protein